MKVIGGFYELLLPEKSFDYHKEAIALSNGRACIGVILKSISIKRCFLPNYTCDAIYHPFDIGNVPYDLYNVDNKMEPLNLPVLEVGEYFYYINYFGVKNNVIKKLYKKYGAKLIIDNTHDFFKKKQFDCWSFTSARKYFGVPDGAFLYSPYPLQNNFERFNLYSLQHNVGRLKGNQMKAFGEYQEYERSLNCEIKKISLVSEKLLSSVNIDFNVKRRKENFQSLHKKLGHLNNFVFSDLEDNDTPFAYPFLPEKYFSKSALYPYNIFIPTLWGDALKRDITTLFEKRLAENLMALPVDERYNEQDINFMANQIVRILDHA